MKQKFTDQLGRKIEIQYPPKRIVSLVPSQTELLCDLGLNDSVNGITKFCVHPESWRKEKTIVGGTKNLHLDKIRELKPDLIIANKEENELMQIEELAKEFPLWISDIKTLNEACSMISAIGEMTNVSERSGALVKKITEKFQFVPGKTKTAAYFIWHEPMMSINEDTFIDDMMKRAGFENVFGDRKDSRYPEISDEELISASPEVILLSSEPFPFSEKHIAHYQSLLPHSKIHLADGEMFSWYGSRLVEAADYLRKFNS